MGFAARADLSQLWGAHLGCSVLLWGLQSQRDFCPALRDAALLRVTPLSRLGSALLCRCSSHPTPQPPEHPLLCGELQSRCFLGPFLSLCSLLSPSTLCSLMPPPPSQTAPNLLPALPAAPPLSLSAPQLVKSCQHSPAVSSAPNKAPFSPGWLLGSGSWARRELCPLIAFLPSEGCAGELPCAAALSIYTLRKAMSSGRSASGAGSATSSRKGLLLPWCGAANKQCGKWGRGVGTAPRDSTGGSTQGLLCPQLSAPTFTSSREQIFAPACQNSCLGAKWGTVLRPLGCSSVAVPPRGVTEL